MIIVRRDQWGSKSVWKYGDMKLPAVNVYLHHSVTPVTEFPFKDTKKVETEGIARFGQGSYSYCFHPDGTILEMAGTKTGAHTADNNSTSFGLCLIGDYDDAPGPDVALNPTPVQIESVRWLIYHLKYEKNWLADTASLTPHRSVSNTLCPGSEAMKVFDQLLVPWIPPPPTEITPMFSPPLVLEPIAAELEHNGGLYLLASNGALYAFGGAPAIRGANGQPYFAGRAAARLLPATDPSLPPFAQGPADAVTIVSTSGEYYGPLGV